MEIKELNEKYLDRVKKGTHKGEVVLHTVSSDFKLNHEGPDFDLEYSYKIKKFYKSKFGDFYKKVPACLHFVDKEHNIIFYSLLDRKEYFKKTDYDSLRGALEYMKAQCEKFKIKKVILYKIGVVDNGKLQWDHVKKHIKKVFKNTDIIFEVYDY